MLHYAERFAFEYLEFGQPFGGDRYLEAVQAAVDMGAKTIIVDSMSHEHEGPGGHLDYHDQEVKRLVEAGGFKTDFAAQIPAWTRPSARRRKLINGLLQQPVNMIFCFRAKEKIKLVKKNGRTEPVELGWQAIAGEEFVYEMTDRFLLVPGCQGRPSFTDDSWATGVPKLPDEHRDFFPDGAQLNEDIGALLAQWAVGKPGPLGNDVLQAFKAIGVDESKITEHLGREPNAHDTKALKNWYRELKSSSRTILPEDKPDTGAESKETEAPQRDAPKEHPSYAKLAYRITKAKDRDAADLVLDEGRVLPDDQRVDLQRVYDEQWPQ